MSDLQGGWTRAELAALSRLDPGPPPPTTDEQLVRHVVKLYGAIDPGCKHTLRWVIHPETRDQLLRMRGRWTGSLEPQPTPDLPETMMGLPVRTDEHATTIMLELIQDPSSSPGNPVTRTHE